MKKSILILLLFCTGFSYAQKLPDFEMIKLGNGAECKTAEPYVLEAANYIFSTPFQKDDLNRLNSLAFMIKWMSATPDYQFDLDAGVMKNLKGNDEVVGLYMAAMGKYVLENKGTKADGKTVKLNAMTIVLNYTDNPANNIKSTKNLKKLSEAKANGQLEQALQ